MQKSINIYDTKKGVIKLAFILLHNSKSSASYLPELYDIVGYDMMVKLFSVFSGITFTFPTVEFWESYYNKAKIYSTVSKTSYGHRGGIYARLSNELGITEHDVETIFYETQKELKSCGLDILLRGTSNV